MFSLAQNVRLEVACPDCSESYAVPLEIVAESQRLLDESGPCAGMASYECPAPYFAALVNPETIAQLKRAVRTLVRDALGHGARAVLINAPTTTDSPPEAPTLDVPVKKVADAISLAKALARWENEGGAAS